MKFTLYYPYYCERTNTIEVEAKEVKKQLQGKEKHWYNTFIGLLCASIVGVFLLVISLCFIGHVFWLSFVVLGLEMLFILCACLIDKYIHYISYDNLQEKYCKNELEEIKQIYAKCKEQKQQAENKKKEWCRKVLEEQDVESLYNIIKMLE